jgi:hypothetical protein
VQKALVAILIVISSYFTPTQANAQEEPHPCEAVNCAYVMYTLRTMPPKDLLLLHVGPRRFAALEPRIQGESHWNCAADNPTSSAAGLGQTMYSKARENTLNSMGLSWAEIAGPDCYADVILIGLLYDACGLGPWTPPYKCLSPLPR